MKRVRSMLARPGTMRVVVVCGAVLLAASGHAQDFTGIDGDFGTISGTDNTGNLSLFTSLVVTAMSFTENYIAPLLAFVCGAGGLYQGFWRGDWGSGVRMIVGALIFAVFPLFLETLLTFAGP